VYLGHWDAPEKNSFQKVHFFFLRSHSPFFFFTTFSRVQMSKFAMDAQMRELFDTVAKVHADPELADIFKRCAEIYETAEPSNAQENIVRIARIVNARKAALTKEHNAAVSSLSRTLFATGAALAVVGTGVPTDHATPLLLSAAVIVLVAIVLDQTK
jgi:hypothetical protein